MKELKGERAERKLKEQKAKQLKRMADDLLKQDDRRQSLKQYNMPYEGLFDLF